MTSTPLVLDPKEARRMARFQQFAMVAADEAVADAGSSSTRPRPTVSA
jgi:3-oxoacyl-(acyl-carrier-protein) synthase